MLKLTGFLLKVTLIQVSKPTDWTSKYTLLIL